MNLGSIALAIHKFSMQGTQTKTDMVAVEEPLEIRLRYSGNQSQEINQTITVTMRTPGQDQDLALGFLYTEGVIEEVHDVLDVSFCGTSNNIIRVKLHENAKVDLKPLNRHGITNSSCGICGKTSIEALRTKLPQCLLGNANDDDFFCDPVVVAALPALLKNKQSLFEQTGGLHASALFSVDGELQDIREDVGRHNALDKLIGSAFSRQALPLRRSILVLSGRISFELVQKASMAGIRVIAAVGAPSSLAVALAQERGMTLLGFIREERFNVYSGAERLRDGQTWVGVNEQP
jgi:FdhD protein